jgi:signal transduction histidine kinase
VDDFQRLERRAYLYLMFIHGLLVLFALNFFLIATNMGYNYLYVALADGVATVVFAHFAARLSSKIVMQPFRALWQAILHVSPEENNVPPPNIEQLHFGRELVVSLTNRVYQFAGSQDTSALVSHREALSQATNVVAHFPLPIFVFNKDLQVTNASESALDYIQLDSPQLFGKKLFDVVNLEFPSSSNTLESWIQNCQADRVTDQAYWQRVRVRLTDGKTVRQCDMAAYYNRENQSGTEFIVTMFDYTSAYDQDDQSLSFVALAVHELRTPLTMLRGYIEVFEEELEGKLSPELTDYMHKLRLSTDQLTSFVSNILNVVRVDQNQLVLNLTEGNWEKVLRQASGSMQMRAQVLGKTIRFEVAPNLPTVAIDPVTISEVVNNLLDNALKYSGDSKEIVVTATLNGDGLVETTVLDRGVGIPESVLPNLFEKFYRNHRTRNQVGGTGLGLYLTKAVITAHDGNIWVKSKVGEGSAFSFTLVPYANLAEEKKGDKGIERQAHGWIKNHSMYRR